MMTLNDEIAMTIYREKIIDEEHQYNIFYSTQMLSALAMIAFHIH